MLPPRRYRLDTTAQRSPGLLVGGSPLRLFRVTPAGDDLLDRIVSGAPVAESVLVTALLDGGAIHPDHGMDAPTGPFTAIDVTVIVPTLGEPSHVPAGPGPTIVVDDGSEPPVPGATLRLDTNRGPGVARNAGLAEVTTPLVAFVDGDVELPERWLDALLPHFADERVGLVAPRVRTDPGPTGVARYESDHSPLDLGPEPARVRAGSRVSFVPAAALVCRTEAVRELGGFDPSLRYGEDVDLVWRLDEAGWRCRYEPDVVVRHAPRPDWAAWARQRIGYGSSTAPLARRHPGALAPVRMNGWSLGAWVLAAIGRPALGAAIGVGSSVALIKKLPELPPRDAFRLAALGNLHAGDQLAHAIRRVWWPLLAVAAWRSRLARRALLASLLAARTPVRLADDLAYSIGVWRSIVDERTLDPLVPEISSWPPKRRTSGPKDPPGTTTRF